jgi:hypothetical protein
VNGILIFLAIVVISSSIGAVSRWLKNQQMEEQARLARQRAGQRNRAQGQNETAVDTIDRYVAGAERSATRLDGPPVVKPRRAQARPVVRREQGPICVESLPVAPVVSTSYLEPTRSPVVPVIVTPGASLFPQAAEAGESPITGPSANRPDGRSELTRTKYTAVPPLLALLSTRQGLFTAVALAEILGPPRCKKRFHG